jgi:integrase
MSTKKVRAPKSTAKQVKRANGQGSIYFDKEKNRYIVAVADFANPIKRRKKSFYTMKEAEAFCHEYIRNRGLGKSSFAADPKIKVSAFLASWHKTVRREEETKRSYDTAIRNWINPIIGNVKVSDLTPAIIEGVYAKLDEQGKSDSVLHITHTVLSLAFKDAVRLGLVSYNPMTNVKKMRKKVIPSKHIPKADADKIYLTSTQDPFLHARVELGMVMGLRPGEALGLKWSDIDWNSRTVTIERQLQRAKGNGLVFKDLKTHDSRVLPLSIHQIAILKIHQLTQEAAKVFWQKDHGLVFPNGEGRPKDTKADHRDWKKLLKSAGVTQNYTRYQMRKTAITNLITNGVDEKTAATIAGHSTPVVTMKHYANATTASMLAALEVQDAIRPTSMASVDSEIEEQVASFIEQLNEYGMGA